MQTGEPSRTAWAAAAHRAVHQVLEKGRIFSDPLAVRILGEDQEALVQRAEQQRYSRGMRIFIAARSRYAEDALAAAVDEGVRQLVVLGAGLDTYAYRTTLGDRLHIFEVDHPDTQAWKRHRLGQAGITVPSALTFAPVDFERQTLTQGLEAAGFDRSQKTFFTWLGVVPYLTLEAIWSTLGLIAALPGGAHVVFDYGDPPDTLSPEIQAAFKARAERVAALNEAWVTYFDAADLHPRLSAIGFSRIRDLGPKQIAEQYFPAHADSAQARGGHILHASTV